MSNISDKPVAEYKGTKIYCNEFGMLYAYTDDMHKVSADTLDGVVQQLEAAR